MADVAEESMKAAIERVKESPQVERLECHIKKKVYFYIYYI